MKALLNTYLWFYLMLLTHLVSGQSSSLIKDLEFVLFEKDIDQMPYIYKYWSIKEQDSIQIDSRYQFSRKTLKSNLVNNICDTIRWSGAIHTIPSLTDILKKQENIFLTEWNPVFEFTGAPEGLWQDQFNSLCILDLTISYLEILKENWSSSKKYKFVKNLYLLSYGDYDENRLNKTLYKSKYLNQSYGYCRCNLIQKSNYQISLLDEFFFNDPEMIDCFLDDIKSSSSEEVPQDYKKFFTSAMRNILYKFADARIDSLLIFGKNDLYNLGFVDNVDIWKGSELSLKYYHLLLGRYRFISKNEQFIDILLDDIFANIYLISDKKSALEVLLRENDHLIEYKIREQFLVEFFKAKSEAKLDDVIKFCYSTLSIRDIDKLITKLNKLRDDKVLPNESIDKILKKIK